MEQSEILLSYSDKRCGMAWLIEFCFIKQLGVISKLS